MMIHRPPKFGDTGIVIVKMFLVAQGQDSMCRRLTI